MKDIGNMNVDPTINYILGFFLFLYLLFLILKHGYGYGYRMSIKLLTCLEDI